MVFEALKGVYTSASDITGDWNIDSENGQNVSPSNPTFIANLDSPTSTMTSLGALNSQLRYKGRFAPATLQHQSDFPIKSIVFKLSLLTPAVTEPAKIITVTMFGTATVFTQSMITSVMKATANDFLFLPANLPA